MSAVHFSNTLLEYENRNLRLLYIKPVQNITFRVTLLKYKSKNLLLLYQTSAKHYISRYTTQI